MDGTTSDFTGPPLPTSEALASYARSIVETVRTPLLVLDAGLRVLIANRDFYRTFRVGPAETEGRRLRELGTGQWDIPRLRELLDALLPGGGPFEGLRVEHDFPHIGRKVLLLNGRRLTAEGLPDRILLAFEDVTERESLERELRQRADELAAADRRKDEFLAMLAHELRNPLGPILAAVELLGRADADPAGAAQAREVVARQVQQMARMVEDLLDASRVTRGRIALRKEVTDLHGVVERAVEMARHHLDARRQRLLVALPPRPALLEADAARLQQVVANLLNNAAKYTQAGGKVTLLAERQGGELLLTVEDTGQGIAPEFLPRVFELFAQEDRSLNRSAGGLGIGLTLVKFIVGLHGGTVEARSPGPGRGSTFVVRLPAPEGLRAPPRPAAQPRPAMAVGRRILAVDDQADTVEMLASLLRLQGHEVRTAYDGPAGLAAAADFGPEVVLLDIGLPGLDGYEVARRLRQVPAARTALLVAVTGYGREVDRAQARAAGFQHHLVKPLDLAALERLLAGLGATRPGEPVAAK